MTRSSGSAESSAGTCASRPAPITRFRLDMTAPSAVRASQWLTSPSTRGPGSSETHRRPYSTRTSDSEEATHWRYPEISERYGVKVPRLMNSSSRPVVCR
ncbi:hypothetical protein EES44_27205 [Streptomyces sp. ADI96-15]|nr:hypothetical protein EES44_27205 [Streptomyces sp. ADI96-15]